MNVDSQTLSFIQSVVRTASLAKINNIIIEPGRIRAIDDSRTVAIFQIKDVPDLPFGSIGINRIDVFADRLAIAESASGFSVDVTVKGADTDTPWAQALTFKGKGVKVDYRCANPLTILAPKTLNDADQFKFSLTPEMLMMLQKGQTAMKADVVALQGNDDGVFMEIADINADALTYQISESFDNVSTGTETKFSHKYSIKTVLPLFKNNPTCDVYLTTKGMLRMVVNKLDVFIIPSV